MKLNHIAKLIKKSKSILLLTHEYPDGDALGSTLGFQLALEKMGKSVKTVCFSDVPALFSFLPKCELIRKDFLLGDYDLIIVLDCGDSRRTGFADRIKELSKWKNKIINIDHHPKNDLHKIAKYNLVDYNASSTAEIVYEIIREFKVCIDKNIALCLLCGLYTDTGSFKHSNTTSKTLKIASELLSKGARLKKITENVINNHSVPALRLWGIALSRMQINQKYMIASSAITIKDIRDCKASHEDAAGIVNMINTVPGIKIAIFLYEIDCDMVKASLRTEEQNINLSKVAGIFGGGGLKKASGFTIGGKILVEGSGFKIKYT